MCRCLWGLRLIHYVIYYVDVGIREVRRRKVRLCHLALESKGNFP